MTIKQLAKKYNLTKDDFWLHKPSGKYIITHDGVTKIANQEGIEFADPVVISNDHYHIALFGKATKGKKVIWTTGESSPENTKIPYPWAIAEKRLRDRLTLKMINAYEHGIYSESEADEFSSAKTEVVSNEKPEKKNGKVDTSANGSLVEGEHYTSKENAWTKKQVVLIKKLMSSEFINDEEYKKTVEWMDKTPTKESAKKMIERLQGVIAERQRETAEAFEGDVL